MVTSLFRNFSKIHKKNIPKIALPYFHRNSHKKPLNLFKSFQINARIFPIHTNRTREPTLWTHIRRAEQNDETEIMITTTNRDKMKKKKNRQRTSWGRHACFCDSIDHLEPVDCVPHHPPKPDSPLTIAGISFNPLKFWLFFFYLKFFFTLTFEKKKKKKEFSWEIFLLRECSKCDFYCIYSIHKVHIHTTRSTLKVFMEIFWQFFLF